MKNDKLNPAAIQHNITQKSQAIYRHAIKQPVSQIAPLVRKIGHNMDIARSKSIAHFAPHSAITPPKLPLKKKHFDVGPVRHPLLTKVDITRSNAKIIQPQLIANNSAKAIKEAAITEAFNKISDNQKAEKKHLKRNYKFINFFAIGIVLLLIIGYFIYISMPIISVNVASAQAGIKATYPEYCPDGYSLSGPVAYSDGQVTISFHANTGDKKFIIKQSRSSWDSSAVKNKVSQDSNGEFTTTEKGGLTIYTYGGNAAWVNGGILYNISGNALLSGDQIRRIATSL